MCRLPQDPHQTDAHGIDPWRRPPVVHVKRFLLRLGSCLIRHRFDGSESMGGALGRHSLGRQHLYRRIFRRRRCFSGRGSDFLFSRRLRIDKAGRSASSCVTTSEGFAFPFCAAAALEHRQMLLRWIFSCGFCGYSGPAAAYRSSTLSIPAMICSFFILYLQFLFFPSCAVHNTTTTGSPTSQRKSAQCHRKLEALCTTSIPTHTMPPISMWMFLPAPCSAAAHPDHRPYSSSYNRPETDCSAGSSGNAPVSTM